MGLHQKCTQRGGSSDSQFGMSWLYSCEPPFTAVAASVEVSQFGDALRDLVEVAQHPPNYLRTLGVVRNALGNQGKFLGCVSHELREVFSVVDHSPVLEYGLAYCLHHFLGRSDSQGRILIGGTGEAIYFNSQCRQVGCSGEGPDRLNERLFPARDRGEGVAIKIVPVPLHRPQEVIFLRVADAVTVEGMDYFIVDGEEFLDIGRGLKADARVVLFY